MSLHSLDPLDPKVTQFIQDNPQGVLTTYRRNGKAQMSIVTVRPHRGVIGVSITEGRAKFNNLVHNPACSILVSTADWWSGFIVFDGTAELVWRATPTRTPCGSPDARSTAQLRGAGRRIGMTTTVWWMPIGGWR